MNKKHRIIAPITLGCWLLAMAGLAQANSNLRKLCKIHNIPYGNVAFNQQCPWQQNHNNQPAAGNDSASHNKRQHNLRSGFSWVPPSPGSGQDEEYVHSEECYSFIYYDAIN